jgi:hypothetical protein
VSLPEPEPLAIEEISAIECRLFRYRFDGGVSVLVFAPRGVWRDGSAGKPDGRVFLARTRAALIIWEPSALVFDFTELGYRWGDTILGLLDIDVDPPHTPLPRAIVAGPDSRAGLASLGVRVSEDLDDAVARVHREAVELQQLEDDNELSLVMYILIRDSIGAGDAALGAAHAAVATYERFEDRWETRLWISGVFRKVVCRVDDAQFEKAKGLPDHVVITESALEGAEVAIGLMPRVEWPKWLRFVPLYR